MLCVLCADVISVYVKIFASPRDHSFTSTNRSESVDARIALFYEPSVQNAPVKTVRSFGQHVVTLGLTALTFSTQLAGERHGLYHSALARARHVGPSGNAAFLLDGYPGLGHSVYVVSPFKTGSQRWPFLARGCSKRVSSTSV